MVVISILPSDMVGLPKTVSIPLATFALLFALNSFLAWKSTDAKRPLWVAAIGLLNLAYCLAASTVIVFLGSTLHKLELAYLIIEIIIVLPLAIYEMWLARNASSQRP